MIIVSDDVQFNLRIPATLKDKVKDAAKESGRSINAEAQYRLEESFNQTPATLEDYEKTVQKMLFNVMANLHKEGVKIEVIDEAMDKAINDIDCSEDKPATKTTDDWT